MRASDRFPHLFLSWEADNPSDIAENAHLGHGVEKVGQPAQSTTLRVAGIKAGDDLLCPALLRKEAGRITQGENDPEGHFFEKELGQRLASKELKVADGAQVGALLS